MYSRSSIINGALVQSWLECHTVTVEVTGSSPVRTATHEDYCYKTDSTSCTKLKEIKSEFFG